MCRKQSQDIFPLFTLKLDPLLDTQGGSGDSRQIVLSREPSSN